MDGFRVPNRKFFRRATQHTGCEPNLSPRWIPGVHSFIKSFPGRVHDGPDAVLPATIARVKFS